MKSRFYIPTHSHKICLQGGNHFFSHGNFYEANVWRFVRHWLRRSVHQLFFMAAIVLSALFFANPLNAQQEQIDSIKTFLASYTAKDTVRVLALKDLSAHYQYIDLKEAEDYAKQALDLSSSLENKKITALCLSKLANVYNWERKSNDALQACFKQIDLAKQISDTILLIDAYLGIAYVHELESEYEQALSFSLKALPIAESSSDKYYTALCCHFVGGHYMYLGDYAKADFFLRRASDIYNSIDRKDELADTYNNLGQLFAKKKNFDSSQFYFDKSLEMFTALNEPVQLTDVYQHLGDMYAEFGKYDLSKYCYEKNLNQYKVEDVSEGDYALAMIGLGKVALAQKDYKHAAEIFHSEYKKLKNANMKEELLQCLRYMAVADSALGNLDEAFSSLNQYVNLYDSFYTAAKAQASQRMMIEYDLDKKEKENEQLKLQNDLQRQRLAIFAITGIVLLVVGAFLFLMYRQKTQALNSLKEMQKITENKNKELAVLNGVKDKFISMIAHDVRSPLTSLLNTLHLTRQNILEQQDFRDLSQMLEDDVQHLLTMLDNTLHWAREQIHSLHIEKTNFNLYQLVQDVMALYHISIEKKGLKIINTVPQEQEVFTDREIVHTVLRNLLSNSIKFTPAGKSIFTVQNLQEGQVMITIQDEGAGIPEEVMKKIVNKEFISTRGTNNEKGTGLGLLFSFDLLSKLNEKISINTSLAQGTAVTFTISSAA